MAQKKAKPAPVAQKVSHACRNARGTAAHDSCNRRH